MVMIAEATQHGVRLRDAAEDEFLWSDIPMTEQQQNDIVLYAAGAKGRPYDWRSIAGFVFRFWGAKIRGRSDDHADDRVICSELVVWAYRAAGLDLFPGVAPGDVSPGDLAEWMLLNDVSTKRPRLGQFGVQRIGGFFPWLIRLGTFSRYNHAAVVVGDPYA